MAADWFSYFSHESPYFIETRTGSKAYLSGTEGAALALASLHGALDAYQKEHRTVHLILNIPTGSAVDPTAIARTLLYRFLRTGRRDVDFSSLSLSKASFLAANGETWRRLKDSARDTGAHVIDPLDYLCVDDRCPAVTTQGDPIYKDADHL